MNYQALGDLQAACRDAEERSCALCHVSTNDLRALVDYCAGVMSRELIEHAIKQADLREKFGRTVKQCPECKTEQIQLVYINREGGNYKCRHCKHPWFVPMEIVFEHDPLSRSR